MTISDFQKLLSSVAANTSSIQSTTQNNEPKVDIKKKLAQTYSSLPSEIYLSSKKSTSSASTGILSKTEGASVDQKHKVKSYKNLLKLAKAVTPTGLISTANDGPYTKGKEIASNESKMKSREKAEIVKITSSNPHHPDYRPPSSINGAYSAAYKNIPKSKIVSPKKMKKTGKVSSRIPTDLIMLNTKKRDLATVEEIQDELLRKKHNAGNPIIKLKSESILNNNDSDRLLKKNNIESSGRSEKKIDSQVQLRPDLSKKSSNQSIKKRDRNAFDHTSARRDEVSETIKALFGYDRNRYYDDSDSSDMEAKYIDLEREEKKSLRIGKKEDLEEEMKEIAKLNKKKKKHQSTIEAQ